MGKKIRINMYLTTSYVKDQSQFFLFYVSFPGGIQLVQQLWCVCIIYYYHYKPFKFHFQYCYIES